MNRKKTRHMVLTALFIALILLLGFTPLGLIPLAWLAPRAGKRAPMIACAALVLAILPICRLNCQAAPLLDVKKEDMAQTVFAKF